MAIFEMESWYIAESKEKEHKDAMRVWLKWVNEYHSNLDKEERKVVQI